MARVPGVSARGRLRAEGLGSSEKSGVLGDAEAGKPSQGLLGARHTRRGVSVRI